MIPWADFWSPLRLKDELFPSFYDRHLEALGTFEVMILGMLFVIRNFNMLSCIVEFY